MAVSSVPSVSNTQFNQTSTAQSGSGFQGVYVGSENSACEYVSAPIWAGLCEDVAGAPFTGDTKLDPTEREQDIPANPFRPA